LPGADALRESIRWSTCPHSAELDVSFSTAPIAGRGARIAALAAEAKMERLGVRFIGKAEHLPPPRKILSTSSAVRRNRSGYLGP
jgi:hypothetical protein